MTIKEELMVQGMKAADFDRHDSDLYIRVTPISRKWYKSYKYKNGVTTFVDNIEGELWYDVPFGAMDEMIKEREEFLHKSRI